MKNKAKLKTVVVLGVGRVGKAIANDLALDYRVIALDTNQVSFPAVGANRIETIRVNLARFDSRVERIVKGGNLVINALPGHLGFKTLKSVVGLGKSICDISFFAEDPLALDELARKKQVTAVVDCGVAPGLSNMIAGFHSKRMNVENFACYVGGLPKIRTWPYEYKAAWSPSDVIEEYTRPARMVEQGREVSKPALSEVEYLEFDGIGTLEAFNTDGLRTLLGTLPIPNMKEKTLRYPGHSAYMKALKETGFFNDEPIKIGKKKISPRAVTSALLFPLWQLGERENEFTVMRIILTGKEKGEYKKYTYLLYDERDQKSGVSSMARTTGYTCAAVARLILENKITQKGVLPPEFLGMDSYLFNEVKRYLAKKNIQLSVAEG